MTIDKEFLGYELKPHNKLDNLWITPGYNPYIMLSNRYGAWILTMVINDNKIEAQGTTEQEAKNKFLDKVESIRYTLFQIDGYKNKVLKKQISLVTN